MAKVYIFRNYDADELEKNINGFLADKELVDIKINTVPENDILNGFRLWTTAVVIYKDGPSQAEKETSAQIDAAYLEVM